MRWSAGCGCFQSTGCGQVCQTSVADFAWRGRGFFVRSGSRILRGGVRVFWPGDAENGIAWGLGSTGLSPSRSLR